LSRLEDGGLKLGEIIIREEEGTLEVPAIVNMDRGLIEVLACSPWGKLHESLFVVNADPHLLQVGLLLLLGLPAETVGDYPPSAPLHEFKPQGPVLRLRAAWTDTTGAHDRPVEELICKGKAGTKMDEGPWVFTGSAIWEHGFAAQITGTLVATYLDPSAIVNNARPEANDDEAYWICEDSVPREGSKARLIFAADRSKSKSGEGKKH
jgi:hypothetical protein